MSDHRSSELSQIVCLSPILVSPSLSCIHIRPAHSHLHPCQALASAPTCDFAESYASWRASGRTPCDCVATRSHETSSPTSVARQLGPPRRGQRGGAPEFSGEMIGWVLSGFSAGSESQKVDKTNFQKLEKNVENNAKKEPNNGMVGLGAEDHYQVGGWV